MSWPKVRRLDPVSTAGPEPEFTTDWFTANVGLWRTLFEPYQGMAGLQFLEIGSWEGRSALWLLQNVLKDPASRLTCVDRWEACRDGDGAAAERLFDRNLAPHAARLVKMKGASADVLRRLPPASYDVIYVDGSHAAPDVLSDAVLSWPLLRPRGLIVFDDYVSTIGPDHAPGPKVAIDAFLLAYGPLCSVIRSGWQIAVRKNPDAAAGR